MSTRSIRTPSRAGDVPSARAARRVTAHRRPGPALAPAAAESPVRSARPARSSGARILRRWSVAELVARAAAEPRVVA